MNSTAPAPGKSGGACSANNKGTELTVSDGKKPRRRPKSAAAAEICFGIDRPTDEASLVAFLGCFANPELLNSLVPRLTDAELNGLLDQITGLMRNHLTHQEYHRLFLKNQGADDRG